MEEELEYGLFLTIADITYLVGKASHAASLLAIMPSIQEDLEESTIIKALLHHSGSPKLELFIDKLANRPNVKDMHL